MAEPMVACGYFHTVFLKKDGSVWSCGDNAYGQLGVGDTVNRNIPVKMNIEKVKTIACGRNHTILIKTDGTVWACGANGSGQLGVGDKANKNIPTKVDITDVKQAAGSYSHTVFLKTDGTVWGCGDINNQKTPVKLDISDVKQVTSKHHESIFLKNDGTVWAGAGNIASLNATGIKYVAGGGLHAVMVTDKETAYGIGNNAYDQLIFGSANNKDIKMAACGGSTTFFLKKDGTVWGCGWNSSGLLGIGTTTHQRGLVKINIENVLMVASCGESTVFLKNDGSVWSCGSNAYGQLGTGDNTGRTVPTQLNINLGTVYYLLQTASGYKTISNDGLLKEVIADTITVDEIKNEGFVSINKTVGVWNQIEEQFNILGYSPEERNEYMEISHMPEPQLAVCREETDISAFSSIKQFSLTTTGAAGSVRIVFSFDRGKTWNTFIEGAWKGITLSIDSVQADGITPEALSAIPPEKWNEMNTGTLRIACCLSKAAVTDDMAVDTLAVTGDNTSWGHAGHMVEYDYRYPDTSTLVVNLLTDGNYKINYIEQAKKKMSRKNSIKWMGGGAELK